MDRRFRLLILVPLLALVASPASADGVVTQITHQIRVVWDGASLDDAGSGVYAGSNADLGGTNPGFAPQLDRWTAATGSGSVIAAIAGGSSTRRDAVSDDGAWLAFLSRGNPAGENADESVELFLMRTDGSETRQLTHTSAGRPGDVLNYALAGSGNRAVFSANTDPLGTNPSHVPQLFVVDAAGSGLRQLTSTTDATGFDVSISDDGTRIAFAHRGDLTGGNPDLSYEIFAINADGTGLRQLTSSGGLDSGAFGPRISGNGARIVFESAENLAGLNPAGVNRVWGIDWAGTGLKTITPLYPASGPAITDDGQFVFYASWDPSPGNTDGSTEIWRIKYDGTGKTRLTSTAAGTSCRSPEVAGGGSRIAFAVEGPIGSFNADGGPALMVMDSTGGTMQILVDGQTDVQSAPDMTPDGARVVFDWTGNPLGTNAGHHAQLFRLQTDGSGLTQITSLTDGDVWHPRVTDDGRMVVFTSNANPVGSNPSHGFEPFVVKADGSGLLQLTPSGSVGSVGQTTPAVAGNGSWVIFQSTRDLTGGNADGSPELFRVKPDGTSMLQLTSDGDSAYKLPRVDASGTWVVYQISSGVYRIRTDGTGQQAIAPFAAWFPDISGAGDRIAFVSNADPLGANADGSAEVFTWDASTATLSQRTSFPAGSSVGRVRLSRDGSHVAFATDAPVFGPHAVGSLDPYRLTVATGMIERLGSLGADVPEGSFRYGGFVAVDAEGRRSVFETSSDPVLGNSDGSTDLFFVDLGVDPPIGVGRATPTVVAWDADPHPVRYDVVRGDVANLAIAGSTVDLGPVACLADDLARLDTSLAPDAADPAPGQVFFFVLRGTQGSAAGPGSYGQGSGGRERVAGSGGCLP